MKPVAPFILWLRTKKVRMFFILCGLLVISVFDILACRMVSADDAAQKPGKQLLQTDSLTTVVKTTKALIRPFEYLIQASGKIRSAHEQVITSESGGRLIVCNAASGKLFAAGSIIARLESRAIEYRLQRAELSRFNSEKEYQSQLLGYEGLLKGKQDAEAEIIKKKLQVSSGLSFAEQDIKEANYELDKTYIRAPFTGILSDVRVENGQQIRPGQELFRIYDSGNLLLEIKVLEADVFLICMGTKAEVSTVASPQKKYTASVTEVNPYIDENGMAQIKLKLTDTAIVFPGMNCTATIRIAMNKTIVVPREAIVMRSNKPVVFTVADGKAKWNYVKPGRTNGKMVELLEGILPGQQVIISNNLQLAQEAPVIEDAN